MNKDLFALEEKILSFLNKKTNKGKSFSLIFVADSIDPKKRILFSDFETVFRKLELEGTVYHNDEDTWCLFPHEEGLVQGVARKNEKGTVLIDNPQYKRYILNPKDAGYILDGDIIVFKPTQKTSGSRLISNVEKIVKRKNGLVVVSFTRTQNGFELTPLTSKLAYPICLPDVDLSEFNNYDQLLVQIDDEVNYAGVLVGKLIKKVVTQEDQDFIKKNVTSDEEYSQVEFVENSDITVAPTLKKEVRETIYDSQDIKNYMKNAGKVKKELSLDSHTVVGQIMINRYGDGYVEVEDKRYKIKKEFLSDVFDGDTVRIRPSKSQGQGVISAIIEEVVERRNGLVIVEVGLNKKKEIVLNPLNAKLKHPIVLPENFDKPLVEGDLLLVSIGTELKNGAYIMNFIKSIGHKDDPDIDLKCIAAEFEIDVDFTEEQMAEANALPTEVLEKEKVGRVDFTEEKVFSIDCTGTKDRDDALSIKKLENGNYLVGVHIADVTYYIKPGMALWDAIMQRATSVYMLDTVIPMLPHILSNGILSLNEGKERLTISYMMEISPDGDLVSYDIVDGVIKSRKAMTYDDVNKILINGVVPEGYEDYVEELKILDSLAKKTEIKRKKHGAVDFNAIESDTEVINNHKGRPISFVSRKQRAAEKLIENNMLLAGECNANYMILPTAYRVHETPTTSALEDAMIRLHKLGVKVPGIIDKVQKKGKNKGKRVISVRNVVNSQVLNSIINSINDMELRTLASHIILCSMKRARIDANPDIGHYALATPKITRVTSGIRRAEDDIAHYQGRKQRDVTYDVSKFEVEYKKDYEWIAKEAEHITKKQYNAEKAEDAAILLKMAEYVEDHPDEVMRATVTYINEEGIFIRTENGVLGKISPSDFYEDKLLYDDSTLSYVGKYTDIRITIGLHLDVIPVDTKREYRTINFGVGRVPQKTLTKKRAS